MMGVNIVQIDFNKPLKDRFMRVISKEEAKLLPKRPDGKLSIVRGYLMTMPVGQVIVLERQDWKRKTQTPKTYCVLLGRKHNMNWKCETLLDGSGWVIERLR